MSIKTNVKQAKRQRKINEIKMEFMILAFWMRL